MKKGSIGHQPRREFLKLAALTGAAVFATNGAAGETSSAGEFQVPAVEHTSQKMDFLRVKGREIVDGKGNRVRLKGTCPGGWMNMEDFINGHPGAEHTLRAQMEETLGAAKAHFFFERLLDYFFNEDDVIFLQKAGVNVVRFPLNYRHFEDDMAPFRYKEPGFARLEKVLDLCEKHGLYVILDLHSAQGWQNVHWHSDNTSRIKPVLARRVLSGSLHRFMEGVRPALRESVGDCRIRRAERTVYQQRDGRLSVEYPSELQGQLDGDECGLPASGDGDPQD